MAQTYPWTDRLWKQFNVLFRKHLLVDYGEGQLSPPEGFTGVWTTFWPNGRLKLRVEYANGKEHGERVCWLRNRQIHQKGRMEDGECVGVWENFWEDGTKYQETEYFGPGSFDVRWFESDKLVDTQWFRNGSETSLR